MIAFIPSKVLGAWSVLASNSVQLSNAPKRAIALRQNGFSRRIVLIGREREPLYERPPLSKEYLTGSKAFERLFIRPPLFWDDKAIELQLGVSATAVDANGKGLRCGLSGRL